MISIYGILEYLDWTEKFPDYLKEVCGFDLMENFTCEKGLAELRVVDFGLYDLRKRDFVITIEISLTLTFSFMVSGMYADWIRVSEYEKIVVKMGETMVTPIKVMTFQFITVAI